MTIDKKSQAALEFLTTYGWAFLVILIMIGALAYFGILKPSKLLPERCNFGSEIGCEDYLLETPDTLKLRLKNNVGETINVSGINVTSETATLVKCAKPASEFFPGDWKSGEVVDINFSSCGYSGAGFVKGDKGKLLVTLTYFTIKAGSDYQHDVQGEVYATLK
jgi:hypothetical protein